MVPVLQPRTKANILRIPNVGTTLAHHDSVERLMSRKPNARVLSIRPTPCRGGCKRALEKDCFFQGPFAASGSRRLGSSCVQGALPRAVVWFGSPRRNRQGSGGLPLVARRRSLLLAVPPWGLWTGSRELSAGGRARSLWGQEEVPRAPPWSAAKTTRTAQPRLFQTRGRTDHMSIEPDHHPTCFIDQRELQSRGREWVQSCMCGTPRPVLIKAPGTRKPYQKGALGTRVILPTSHGTESPAL